jgi:hypothetical protein
MKKFFVTILLSSVLFSGLAVANTHASTCPPHNYVLYESVPQYSYTRQCREDSRCTVTVTNYTVRYKCPNCNDVRSETQVGNRHSYFH